MAFNIQYFGRVDTNAQTAPLPIYKYRSLTDNLAAISAAGYFDEVAGALSVGTIIFCQDDTDVIAIRTVTAVSPQVTTNAFGAVPVIGTANIDDLAVTTAKIDDLAVTTSKLAANAVTSAKLALNVLQHTRVAVNNAAFLDMSDTPVEIIPAAGANTIIVVEEIALRYLYAVAQSTAGGAVGVQYGNTAALAGQAASATLAAATVNAAVASSSYSLSGVLNGAAAAQTNAGIFLSNTVANFASAGGSLVLDVWYRVISTV